LHAWQVSLMETGALSQLFVSAGCLFACAIFGFHKSQGATHEQ
jgi:hypothetical protein